MSERRRTPGASSGRTGGGIPLPTYEDLSPEQDRIYRLPLDQSTLVTGPPGTGKTVMALYRAQRLEAARKRTRLITHSRLLMMYIRRAVETLDLDGEVNTFWSWFYTWWRKNIGGSPPENGKFDLDWPELLTKIYAVSRDSSLPHLIVDEAQDIHHMFWATIPCHAETVSIFADENQRITEQNSTISQITTYCDILDDNRVLRLNRNYRNTAPIDALARHFHQGGELLADPPTKRGARPSMSGFPSREKEVDRIANLARSFRSDSIGVIVPTVHLQREFARQLNGRESQHRRDVEVYYGSRGRRAAEVSFKPTGITVLCHPSAKGLEFEHVILAGLDGFAIQPGDVTQRMLLYVLVTRARQTLTITWSGPTPKAAELFPSGLVDRESDVVVDDDMPF